jgi:ABC-2 type transport system ATP-binding protein
MTAVIATEGLAKFYGPHRGITDLDMEVEPGEAFGFLGPNGAGKTTTIRLLLDLIRPTAGRALVLGLDSRRDSLAIRARSGYLPGELSLYPRLTGRETLLYFANLRGGVDWGYVGALCERLDFDLTRKVADLSTGNKRKLGLIQAFMHRPELLILDEPTSGLDPLVQHEFYRLVDEVRAAGQTVFLSSHVLPEVQRVCDRVAFIREGSLVALEDVAALMGRALRDIDVVFASPVPATAFRDIPGVTDVSANGDGAASLRLTVAGSLDSAIKKLAEFEVLNLTSHEPDLEDVFMTFYTGGGDEEAAAADGARVEGAGVEGAAADGAGPQSTSVKGGGHAS